MALGRSDEGYFGPRSVTWRIHSSTSLMVGGLRALLVQALNPLAMAAVAEFSNYRDEPWTRLIRTTEYLVQTTFGDTATADTAAERVRKIHRHVRGVDPFTGRSYRADDPELLLWIHAAEVHSFMSGFRYFGGGLSDEDADRYVKEMVKAAELVGLHPEDVPASKGELSEYLRGQDVVASPAAKDAMRFILFPPVVWPGGRYPAFPGSRLLAVPGRLGWAVPSAAAVAILPERARREYGLPWLRPMIPSLRISMVGFVRAMQIVAPPPPELLEARRRALDAA